MDTYHLELVRERLAVDAVAIPDEEARLSFAVRKSLHDLARRPLGRCVRSDVSVDDAPAIMRQHDEGEEHPKGCGRHDEEVARGRDGEVISKERPPRLAWGTTRSYREILGDRRFGDVVTEKSQLGLDARRASASVLGCQANLAGDRSLFGAGAQVSVVGSRKCSAEGEKRTRSLVRTLVERRIIVVNGLTEGIDTVAHETAMEAGGPDHRGLGDRAGGGISGQESGASGAVAAGAARGLPVSEGIQNRAEKLPRPKPDHGASLRCDGHRRFGGEERSTRRGVGGKRRKRFVDLFMGTPNSGVAHSQRQPDGSKDRQARSTVWLETGAWFLDNLARLGESEETDGPLPCDASRAFPVAAG